LQVLNTFYHLYRATLCIARFSDSKSVTFVECTRMVRPTIMIYSLYGSPVIDAKFRLHIPTARPSKLRSNTINTCGVGKKCVFSIKTACISETVSDTVRVTTDH